MKEVKRHLAFLIAALFVSLPAVATAPHKDVVKPVKNLILMIPDGTSLATYSLARWYQRYLNPSEQHLNLDPYISGTVLTYCSNAPIGDSAPTTSAYMTGVPSADGFVATYPFSDPKKDLIPLDSTLAYRPLMTLMEAARILKHKRIGLVFTCEFPHATPADCTAHSYKRSKYDWIIPQMVHNHIDVVIGGGTDLLTQEHEEYLKREGYEVFRDTPSSLTDYKHERIWSLFGKKDMAYDLDRDPTKEPSIAEMTEAAIQRLNKGNEGFVLMVEGSKIDWAAHANDPVAMATDMLAFDRAVKRAIDFAEADGNTVVIVVSDHGNSGISIGDGRLKKYAQASKDELFGNLVKPKKTAVGIANLLQTVPYDEADEVFEQVTGFEMSDEDHELLKHVEGYAMTPLSKEEVTFKKNENNLYTGSLSSFVSYLFNKEIPMGFTTHGHTGEEVLLSVKAPKETHRLTGFVTNIELHEYMKALLGIEESMVTLSDRYYAPHNRVFAGMKVRITGDKPEDKVLEVTKGKKTLRVRAFTSEVQIGKKTWKSPVPAVYVDKTDLFYVDKKMADQLQ